MLKTAMEDDTDTSLGYESMSSGIGTIVKYCEP